MKINKSQIEFIAAFIIVICGIVAMFMGFWVIPIGEIHPSVLTALGECLTFGGSVWGIERTYHYKSEKLESDYRKRIRKEEEEIDD